MDEATIDDLKQFITATISHSFSDMATKDDIAQLRNDIHALDIKVDDIQSAIADALSDSNDEADRRLKNQDRRISKLERHGAKS